MVPGSLQFVKSVPVCRTIVLVVGHRVGDETKGPFDRSAKVKESDIVNVSQIGWRRFDGPKPIEAEGQRPYCTDEPKVPLETCRPLVVRIV